MRLFLSLTLFIAVGLAIILVGKLASPKLQIKKLEQKQKPDLLVKSFKLSTKKWTLEAKKGEYLKSNTVFLVKEPTCTVQAKYKFIFSALDGKYYTKNNKMELQNSVKIFIKTYVFLLNNLNFNFETNSFTSIGFADLKMSDLTMKLNNLEGNIDIETFRGRRARGKIGNMLFSSDFASFLFKDDKIILRQNAVIKSETIVASSKYIYIYMSKGEVQKLQLIDAVSINFKSDNKLKKASSLSATIRYKENKLELFNNASIKFKNGDMLNGEHMLIDTDKGSVDIDKIKGTVDAKELGIEQ